MYPCIRPRVSNRGTAFSVKRIIPHSYCLLLLLLSCGHDPASVAEPVSQEVQAETTQDYDFLQVSSIGFPDIPKAFLGKIPLSHADVGNIRTYSYASDTPLVELKAKLITFLGKGWKEFDAEEPTTIKDLNHDLAAQMDSVVAFTNPSYPEAMFGLGTVQAILPGGKGLVTLTLINPNKFAPGDKGRPPQD